MKKILNFFALFTSMSTLICCALPALLVTLGAGSVMASLASNVPGLIFLSRHKIWVFVFAGIMLCIAGAFQLQSRKLECPIEDGLGESCTSSRKFSVIVYGLSLLIYLIGFFFAFIAPKFI